MIHGQYFIGGYILCTGSILRQLAMFSFCGLVTILSGGSRAGSLC